MLCQNCGKHEANVKYTQIINGEKKEVILCSECSQKLGIDKLDFNIPINFSNFFGEFFDDIPTFNTMLETPKQLQCSKCNMTYDEFLNIGKFGCEECYNTFSEKLNTVLKRIHGSNKHIGRKQVRANAKEKIEIDSNKKDENKEADELKEKLKQAIKEEKYEEAAKLRDKIKSLEKEDNNG